MVYIRSRLTFTAVNIYTLRLTDKCVGGKKIGVVHIGQRSFTIVKHRAGLDN
jgi:hypothetical protein